MRVRDFINIDWKKESLERIIEFAQAQDKYPEELHWGNGLVPLETKCLWDALNWCKEHSPDKNIRILELGNGFCTAGRMFAVWSIINSGIFFTCDLKKRTEIIETLESIGIWKHINFIHGHSLKIDWDKKINFLFIDSEHNLSNVLGEYIRYRSFLPLGAVVGFHDVNLESVQRAIEIIQSIDIFIADYASVNPL